MNDDSLSSFGSHRDVLAGLGNGEPSTRLEAQAVIENIRAEKGYLDAATMRDLNNMPARSRQEIMHVIEKKREMEAQYTRSISEQLYSSKYRFLYELIQNADDSRYTNPAIRTPCLTFRVTPSEFIVETNEEGFKRANVEAICATGRSSKKASVADKHIGEKGFGFKSVFSVADEVRIQSDIWAFLFRHQDGDDGLGMVTPLDAEVEILPKDVTTKMTLRLSDTAKEDLRRLVDAVSEMPETSIFFLQRLKILKIQIEVGFLPKSETTISKHHGFFGVPSTLERTIKHFGSEVARNAEENKFYMFTETIGPMPKDPRREDRLEAKIELGFPISSESQPKVSTSGQHFFAYLPLQRLPQVQFLIQSDFITSASRESVIDCAWNDAIVNGVAKVFAKAVATFATADHPLRYSWLDYLPTKPMDGIWKNLYSSIITVLRQMPVMQTWEKRSFKCPTQLCVLRPMDFHESQPLFRDLQEEVYLAPEYNSKHKAALRDLGMDIITWSMVVARVSADLARVDSYIKTRTPELYGPWHKACACLLLTALRESDQTTRLRIKRLPIIPLSGGTSWTGAPGISSGGLREIYLPDTEGIAIPTDISLNLVEPNAATDDIRRELYRLMGVQDCSKESVLSQIERIQKSRPSSLEVESHSRYLFHFHPSPRLLTSWIYVSTTQWADRVHSDTTDLFFPSEREYDTQQLLPASYLAEDDGVARLLDQSYAQLIPDNIRPQDLSWTQWLQKVTGARYHPAIAKRDSTRALSKWILSPVMLAVLEHRPKKFLGLLKAHWTEYKAYIPHVSAQLRKQKVPCTSGVSLALEDTYLPTVEITTRLCEYGIYEDFPLLDLTLTLDETNQHEWRFLEDVGVHCVIDNNFDQIALRRMMASSVTTKEEVTDVYKSMAERSTLSHADQLRAFFDSCQSIAYEAWPKVLEWSAPTDCIWEGPDFLNVKIPLIYHYGQEPHLDNFFRVWLGIRDYRLGDIFDELDYRRAISNTKRWSVTEAGKVYQFLASNAQTTEDLKLLREAFSQRSMVMGADGRWHTLRSCLWNSPFSLAEYEDLASIYPDLKSFFVTQLRVKNADPAMLVNELARMAGHTEPRTADIRQRLIEVGRIIAKGNIDDNLSAALERLRTTKFLPKQTSSGDIVLVGVEDDFAILDHERFGTAFHDEDVLLDFSLEDVQILDTVFRFMKVTHRYLSNAVDEVSTVGEDAVRNETLERALQAKAYALYCCAAKYKSVKALRGERELFEQLHCTQIYFTANMSTNLVLKLGTTPITVQSDRPALHHELSESQLVLYVPSSQRQRESCYRSQVPVLLAHLLGVSPTAKHDIHLILSQPPEDLDILLSELDIPHVDWIERPVAEVSDLPEDEIPVTPPARPAENLSAFSVSGSTIRETSALRTDAGNSRQPGRTWVNDDIQIPPHTPTRHYERLIEQVVQSAQRASHRQDLSGANTVPLRNAPPIHDALGYTFDHTATFGDRDANPMTHDTRIGAAGEAYIFELLSSLNLPNFGRENWRSTIRGVLRCHSRYADMGNWQGRETADIVYKDQDGSLTRYLREHCTGGFPEGIREDRDFTTKSIEYFLEVKTTTSACHTRFYMSGSQYARMEANRVSLFSVPASGSGVTKVYVILRVFNISMEMSGDVGVKIFVDPTRLRGRGLEFEVGTWHARVTDGV